MAEVLDQFCQLARQQKGLALVFLIEKVISNPKIYVFGELLAVPSVAALKTSPNYSGSQPDASSSSSLSQAESQCDNDSAYKSHKTLELFAYGTYKQYLANPSDYITLTATMQNKLRQLTIVSLAETCKILPYSVLRVELAIESVRQLEDLVIETIYSGIISAKMDQRESQLRIQSFMGRDVRKEDISGLVAQLRSFQNQCQMQIDQVQMSSRVAQEKREETNKLQQHVTKRVHANKAQLKESWSGHGQGNASLRPNAGGAGGGGAGISSEEAADGGSPS